MKLLVIGSGMMGSAAAFDMARTPQVDSVTLADSDAKRVREVAVRVALGERRYAAEWAAGRTLTPEGAVRSR